MDINKIANRIASEIPLRVNPSVLGIRIEKGSFMGPNFYARTSDKIEKALEQNKNIELLISNLSAYGGEVIAVIDGTRYPLTKGKIRNRDFEYFFGPQPNTLKNIGTDYH